MKEGGRRNTNKNFAGRNKKPPPPFSLMKENTNLTYRQTPPPARYIPRFRKTFVPKYNTPLSQPPRFDPLRHTAGSPLFPLTPGDEPKTPALPAGLLSRTLSRRTDVPPLKSRNQRSSRRPLTRCNTPRAASSGPNLLERLFARHCRFRFERELSSWKRGRD